MRQREDHHNQLRLLLTEKPGVFESRILSTLSQDRVSKQRDTFEACMVSESTSKTLAGALSLFPNRLPTLYHWSHSSLSRQGGPISA
jgi:hypothetical protein